MQENQSCGKRYFHSLQTGMGPNEPYETKSWQFKSYHSLDCEN